MRTILSTLLIIFLFSFRSSLAQLYAPNTTIVQSSTGNVGIGIQTPADPLEIVNGTRKVGINGAVPGVNSGLLSISRGDDGTKVMHIGVSQTPSDDGVIYHSGGSSELRFISAGGSSVGFGFYTNTTSVSSAFSGARPTTPVFKISGDGSLGVGTNTPSAKIEVVSDNSLLRFRGSSFASSTPLDLINLGLAGITGAMNLTFRVGYPYSNGVNSGARLDFLKLINGNTILSTDEAGVALGRSE